MCHGYSAYHPHPQLLCMTLVCRWVQDDNPDRIPTSPFSLRPWAFWQGVMHRRDHGRRTQEGEFYKIPCLLTCPPPPKKSPERKFRRKPSHLLFIEQFG